MKAIFKNLISSFASKAAVSVAAIFLMGGAALFAQPAVKGKVTDANGQFVLTFPEAGVYTLSAVSSDMTLVPPVCILTVAE